MLFFVGGEDGVFYYKRAQRRLIPIGIKVQMDGKGNVKMGLKKTRW